MTSNQANPPSAAAQPGAGFSRDTLNTGTRNDGVNTQTENNRDSDTGAEIPRGTTASIPSNMSSQQFSTFVTGRWDRNGDGLVSQSEWDAVTPTWYGTTGTRPFSTWDLNGNGTLESNEMDTVFSGSRLYQIYDTNGDGVIDSAESSRIPRD